MILVMFGMDRKSVIAAGENYPAVKQQIDAIRGNDLGAHLRNQEYTLAITSTLDALDSAANGRLAPPPVYGGTSQSSSGPSGETVLKVFLWILGGIAVIAGLFAIGFGVRRFVQNRAEQRAREEARLEAQADARKAYSAAAAEVTSVKTDEEYKRDFLMATGNMPKSMIARQQETFNSIDKSCDAQIVLFDDLNESPSNNVHSEQSELVYRELERQYTSIAEKVAAMKAAYKQLFEDIKEEVVALTPQARKVRWVKISDNANGLRQELNVCQQVFNADPTREKLASLLRQIQDASGALDSVERAVESYDQLGVLEESVAKLTDEVNGLVSDRTRILEAQDLFRNQIAARRRVLQNLQHVNADNAVAFLGQMESASARFIATNLHSMRPLGNQLRSIDEYLAEIDRVGSKEVGKDAAIEAKERKKRDEAAAAARRKREAEEAAERKRRREREEEERRDRERRRNDSFSGGFAGGYIGGSLGSSSNDSWGGGGSSYSSGDWGGGGGSSSSSGDW